LAKIKPFQGTGRFSRKAELGHSRAGQSPYPGSRDLYLLSVSMEIICPGWLKLKQKCWVAWGLSNPGYQKIQSDPAQAGP